MLAKLFIFGFAIYYFIKISTNLVEREINNSEEINLIILEEFSTLMKKYIKG